MSFDESAKLVQLSGSKTIIARQRYGINPELAESIVTPDMHMPRFGTVKKEADVQRHDAMRVAVSDIA